MEIFFELKKREIFLKQSFLVCIAFCIPTIIAGAATNTPDLYIIIFCFCSFPCAAIILHFFLLYRQELAKRKMESLVPDLLLQASAFPRGISVNKIFSFFAKADFGLLGREFETA
ncbi:MAG: hypothetical protein PHH08_03905, partial [Candidatus ainarchaeum sp.]|nr:hypothetical protein [Candidatus ainarchaeum sp.]